jgi:glycosyltransferase involved in cell wall biosynthesis
LAARGHQQLIMTVAGSALERRARAAGLAVAALPAGPISFLRAARDFDIVHTHSGKAQTPVWLLGPMLRAALVATRHVAFEPKNRRIHRWKYGRGCDGVIAVSHAVRAILLRAGVPEAKIEVITTGVEIPPALPAPEERAAARAALQLSESDFAIGHMGAFTAEKGQDVAISAAAQLYKSLPHAHFILAGSGPMSASLREQLKRERARVLLPGFLADRGRFFAALDLFIMPSRAEAWGLAALEAMAFGVPVIASDVGGLAEIVSSREGGRLIPPGDARALADAIKEAESDRERLRSAGLAGRERARKFSVEETVEKTEVFYRRLLASTGISGIG